MNSARNIGAPNYEQRLVRYQVNRPGRLTDPARPHCRAGLTPHPLPLARQGVAGVFHGDLVELLLADA